MDNILKGEVKAVENNADPQQPFGAEENPGDPCRGESVSEAVGIEHPEDNPDNQGAEREASDEGGFGNPEGGTREEGDKQHAVEHIASVFTEFHALR